MSWLDEVSDTAELKQCVRDLVALSGLPAAWTGMAPAQVCDSAGAALVPMLDAEIVYLRMVRDAGEVLAETANTRLGPATGTIPALRRSFSQWLSGQEIPATGMIANPFGSGTMHVASVEIGAGHGSVISVGAVPPGLPTGRQRLLLQIAADEASVAVDHWWTEQREIGSMRQLNQELADQVAGQTADLAAASEKLVAERLERDRSEGRLREVQLELFHASRIGAAGEMATNIAHELSQPLTAAASSLSAFRRLLSSGNPGQAAEAVEEAAGQIERASEILRMLRQYVGNGRTRRQIESVRAILDDALAFAMVGTDALGIHLYVRQDPAATLVYVDRLQIQQVLVNLLRNAVEAMRESARRELNIGISRRPDNMVEVSVTDSGRGLPEQVAQHLFEPFVSTKNNGLGLGLSISRSIVQANGGELTVGPGEGAGTVFRFTLAPVLAEAAR